MYVPYRSSSPEKIRSDPSPGPPLVPDYSSRIYCQTLDTRSTNRRIENIPDLIHGTFPRLKQGPVSPFQPISSENQCKLVINTKDDHYLGEGNKPDILGSSFQIKCDSQKTQASPCVPVLKKSHEKSLSTSFTPGNTDRRRHSGQALSGFQKSLTSINESNKRKNCEKTVKVGEVVAPPGGPVAHWLDELVVLIEPECMNMLQAKVKIKL